MWQVRVAAHLFKFQAQIKRLFGCPIDHSHVTILPLIVTNPVLRRLSSMSSPRLLSAANPKGHAKHGNPMDLASRGFSFERGKGCIIVAALRVFLCIELLDGCSALCLGVSWSRVEI